MNFTTLEHIKEIINDGAIYWTLRDRNNSAILAEQTAGMSAGDSYDKLTRNIKEMRGDFVKLTLSQRAQAEKSAGGNTKSYGPFNIEIQSNTNTPALIGAAPAIFHGGDYDKLHLKDREIFDLKWENYCLKRDLEDQKNSIYKDIFKQFGPGINKFLMGDQTPTPEISGAGVSVVFESEQTAKHVFNLSQRPQFAEVVQKLDDGGLLAWSVVLNQLNPSDNANI